MKIGCVGRILFTDPTISEDCLEICPPAHLTPVDYTGRAQ